MDIRVQQNAAAKPEHADKEQPGDAMDQAQPRKEHADPVEPGTQGKKGIAHPCAAFML